MTVGRKADLADAVSPERQLTRLLFVFPFVNFNK